MPEIGEVRYDYEIGRRKHWNKFVWLPCAECGKLRWVNLCGFRQGHCLTCNRCHCKRWSHPDYTGKRNPHWRGGKFRIRGYTMVKLLSDDFFYPMADRRGYVAEHRLVYAQHLGRCLQSWEIVHHKEGKLNNKGEKDNSFSNLQLTTYGQHDGITQLEKKINRLLEGQEQLKQEIRLLRLENKLLKEQERERGLR